MGPVILNQCDAWQSYASFKLVGVFTNRERLNSVLNSLIKDDLVDFNNENPVHELSIEELQNSFTYLNFNEIEFNEDYS